MSFSLVKYALDKDSISISNYLLDLRAIEWASYFLDTITLKIVFSMPLLPQVHLFKLPLQRMLAGRVDAGLRCSACLTHCCLFNISMRRKICYLYY